jgi:hypothetical protein
LKGLFGASRTRRVSYDFRHGARASVWHEICARSHLVVAAVGTIVFLAMAGTAIWMALPSDRGPARLAEQAKPAGDTAASVVARAAKPAEPVREPVRNAEELRAQTAGTEPAPAGGPGPLAEADSRWIASDGKNVKAALRAAAGAVVQDAAADIVANAYAGEDAAATAAIPAGRPDAPKAGDDDAAAQSAQNTRESRALRAVTMRSRPSSRGSVLGTVPARATVEVISCSSWCEILYDGKHGYVYKGFLRNGGR